MPFRFHFVAPHRVPELREAARPRLLGSDAAGERFVASLPEATPDYKAADAYFAFLLGYLEDEAILEPVHEDLTEELQSGDGHLFSLYAPTPQSLDAIDPSRFREASLAAAFADDAAEDPRAGAAMMQALRTLHDALTTTGREQLLLVHRGYS